MAKVRLTSTKLNQAPPATGQVELWDDLVAGFGLRIAAGGSRTFFVMKRLNGTLVRRTVGRVPAGLHPNPAKGELTLAAARLKAKDMIAALQSGTDTKATTPIPALVPETFGAVAAAYVADPSRGGAAKLASKPEIERKVRVDLAAWADRPIASITKAEIKAVLAEKRRTAPVSANRLLSAMKGVFGWAAREDIIEASPAASIEGADEDSRDRVLTMSEIGQVWLGAEKLGYPYGPLIQILILTAQRKSEVAELEWNELDQKVWRLPDHRTKRRKGHLVPLSPRALAILEGIPRIGKSERVVFTTGRRQVAKGGKQDPSASPAPVKGWSRLKDRLDEIIAKQAAAAAGEPLNMERHALPHWTIHDLRRSVATHLRDQEVMGEDRVDRLTVSKILNHAEGGMTQIYDRYASDPEKRRALDAWADRIERLCGLNVVALKGGVA